jgi:hypothetical protein
LASYDQVKQVLRAPFLPLIDYTPLHFAPYKLPLTQTILKLPGFKDDVVTHLFAGLGAGFFAVCVGSPVDVVRCPLPVPHATITFRNTNLGCHCMS